MEAWLHKTGWDPRDLAGTGGIDLPIRFAPSRCREFQNNRESRTMAPGFEMGIQDKALY